MKRHILFFTLLFSIYNAYSQASSFLTENAFLYTSRQRAKTNSIKENHVKGLTLVTKNGSNGKIKATTITRFATNGRPLSSEVWKNGKLINGGGYVYLNDSQTSYSYRLQKGDTVCSYRYYYDEQLNNNCIETYRKGKLLKTEYLEYNSMRKPGGKKAYVANGNLLYRFEYDYYDNGSRKEIRYFNKKNMLKKRWVYTCDPRGEELKPKEDLKQYCKKINTFNDGSFVEVFETLNKKQQVEKNLLYYNKDSLMVRTEMFTGSGKMRYRAEYEYLEGLKKVNKLTYTNAGEESVYFSYTYNEKGLCVKEEYSNKKGQTQQVEELQYQYF